MVFASGNGGQTIWIAPALDLIVVTTMGNYNTPTGDRAANEIIRAVVAAASDRTGVP